MASSPASFASLPLLRVIQPSDDGWSTLAWCAFSADHRVAARGECTVAELPAAGVVEVVLPARRLAGHRLTLPAHAGKHFDAVIGQALEDRLLGDKADVLALPGKPLDADGRERRVWVCSRRWLEGGLERLAAAGRHVARLIPEYELLPETAGAVGTVDCAHTVGGVIFRTAEGRFGIVRDEAAVAPLIGNAPLACAADIVLRPCPPERAVPLPRALARFAGRRFDPRPWRRTLALLAALAGLALLGALVHWRQLEAHEARLRHEIRQTFAAAFPGTPIVDPVLQWESLRREPAAATGDAIDAAVRLAALVDAPIHPRRIEAGDGVVRLTLTDADAVRFKTQLDAAGTPQTGPAGTGLTRFDFRLGAARP